MDGVRWTVDDGGWTVNGGWWWRGRLVAVDGGRSDDLCLSSSRLSSLIKTLGLSLYLITNKTSSLSAYNERSNAAVPGLEGHAMDQSFPGDAYRVLRHKNKSSCKLTL